MLSTLSLQHEGDGCYLNFAIMILEHHKEENRPAWSWSPTSPVSWWPACWHGWYKAAAPQVFQLLSPVRAILQRPAVSPTGRSCSLWELQLQYQWNQKSLEWFYWEELCQDHITSWGIPELSFPSCWRQQSPHFLLRSLPLNADGWSWPILS